MYPSPSSKPTNVLNKAFGPLGPSEKDVLTSDGFGWDVERLEVVDPLLYVSCLDMICDLLEAGHGCPHLLDLLHEEGAIADGAWHAGPETRGAR